MNARFLLLQIRNAKDPMREQEIGCFSRALGRATPSPLLSNLRWLSHDSPTLTLSVEDELDDTIGSRVGVVRTHIYMALAGSGQ